MNRSSQMNIANKELSIKQNMLWNMIGSAVGLGCQWAISILVVRLAPNLTTAGLYSLAMSVYGIFSPIAQFGMYTYLITDTDEKGSSGEYATLVCGTSLLACSLTIIYAAITCRPNSWLVIAAFSVYKGLAAIIDILHAVDQKEHRMDYVGISLALQGIISLVLFAGAYTITRSLTLSIVFMALGTLLIGVFYDLPRTRFLSPLHLGISPQKAKVILSSCLLIVVASVANGAFSSLPRQALSAVHGDTALGIYASIATPVAIIQVGSTYIYNPLIGYFAESYHAKDGKGFARLSLFTLFGIALIGVASLLISKKLAYPLLALLYGQDVASHSELMTALIASSVLLGVAGFLSNLLVAVRSLGIMVFGSVAALFVTGASSQLFIMHFGMDGATFSLIAGCITSILISLLGIIRKAVMQFQNSYL